jgi:hypothetical protein
MAAGCAEVRASAVATVRCCGKASGGRCVWRVSRGRVAPALWCVCQLSCRCRMRGYAPSGPRRAGRALEAVESCNNHTDVATWWSGRVSVGG